MNIFLTQFWTEKLLIHKPQPRHMLASFYDFTALFWPFLRTVLKQICVSVLNCQPMQIYYNILGAYGSPSPKLGKYPVCVLVSKSNKTLHRNWTL